MFEKLNEVAQSAEAAVEKAITTTQAAVTTVAGAVRRCRPGRSRQGRAGSRGPQDPGARPALCGRATAAVAEAKTDAAADRPTWLPFSLP